MNEIEKALNSIKCGSSIRQAAKKYSISTKTLARHAKNDGILSSHQKLIDKNAAQHSKIRDLRRSGLSYSKISEQTNCSESSIKNICHDIILSQEKTKINLKAKLDKQKMAVNLRKEGMYTAEISNKLNVSKGSVNLWLSEFRKIDPSLDDKTNKRKQLGKQEKQKVYQPKKRSRPTDEKGCFLSEDHLSKEVLKYRKDGYSYTEISSILKISKKYASSLVAALLNNENEQEIKTAAQERLRRRRKNGALKPAGGYRENSGRSKSGYYKGLYCGSTYELCWALYALDNNIKFTRFPTVLEGSGVKYIPDFLLGDGKTIIELKGYEKEESVQKKSELAISLGYNVQVLRKEDLLFAFDHVRENYNISPAEAHKLYDGFKPKHTIFCSGCGDVFYREKIQKKYLGKNMFCSRVCTGKHNKAFLGEYKEKLKNDENLRKEHTLKSKKKGRQKKLTLGQVIEIFNAVGKHFDIAEKYGIHKSMVGFIKRKKVYKDFLKEL